jgi:hypothetical protein
MDPRFPLGKVALAQLYLDKGMEDKTAQEYLKLGDDEIRGNATSIQGTRLKGVWRN